MTTVSDMLIQDIQDTECTSAAVGEEGLFLYIHWRLIEAGLSMYSIHSECLANDRLKDMGCKQFVRVCL